MFSITTKVIIYFLVLVLFLSFRIPYINMVLGPDSATWMYMADRMLEGDVLYKDLSDNKPPGIYFLFVFLIFFFGKSILSIRLFLMIYSLLTVGILYLLAKRLYDKKIAIIATLFFAMYSGIPIVDGFEPFTEAFLILPMMISIYLFLMGEEKDAKGYFVTSGLFHGIAFLFKPTAFHTFIALSIFLIVGPFLYRTHKKLVIVISKLVPLTLGFLLPLIIVFMYFLSKNAVGDLFLSVFIEPSEYSRLGWSNPLLLNRFLTGVAKVIIGTLPLWVISVVAIKKMAPEFCTRSNIIILLLTFFSLISISSTGFFSAHYFIQIIPFLCILSGLGFSMIVQDVNDKRNYLLKSKQSYFIKFILLSLVISMVVNVFYYFAHLPYKRDEHFRAMTDFVKQNSSPEDCIYAWGTANQIYFYSNRRSASKYLNYLPITWIHTSKSPEILSRVISDLAQNKPRLIFEIATIKNYPRLYQFVQAFYTPVEEIYLPVPESAFLIFRRWFSSKDNMPTNKKVTIYKRRA